MEEEEEEEAIGCRKQLGICAIQHCHFFFSFFIQTGENGRNNLWVYIIQYSMELYRHLMNVGEFGIRRP